MSDDVTTPVLSRVENCSTDSPLSVLSPATSEALGEAVTAGNYLLVRHIVSECAPAQCCWTDAYECSLLHIAASLPSPSCLIELLQSKLIFMLSQNCDGETPLHTASRYARSMSSVLLLVLRFGATAIQDDGGNTFLHLLLMNPNIDSEHLLILVEHLLQREDVLRLINILNKQQETPCDVASAYHGTDAALLQLLLRHGAVSGSLLFRDEVGVLVSEEHGTRQSMMAMEAGERELWQATEESVKKRMNLFRHQRKKLLAKETKKRVSIVEKEERAMSLKVEKLCSVTLKLQRQEALATDSAATLQRLGRGLVSRQRVGELARLRQHNAATEECVTCVPESTAVEQTEKEMEGDVTGDESPLTAHIEPESREAPYLIAMEEVDVVEPTRNSLVLKLMPTNMIVFLQSMMRMRLKRRKYNRERRQIIRLQRTWRRFLAAKGQRQDTSIGVVLAALRRHDFHWQLKYFVEAQTLSRIRVLIQEITRCVTQLIWRENFCSVFCDIVFLERRQKPQPTLQPTRYRRFQNLLQTYFPWVSLTQILVSIFLLIYMGCIPRTRATAVHNNVDIAFICIQGVIACFLPWKVWRIVDFAVIATAVACAAAQQYGGPIVITFFLMKIPFVVRSFVPKHPGTRTYCRAIQYSAFFLITLLPIALASVGSSVRGTVRNSMLLSSKGNWGSVCLILLSTLAPQYTIYFISSGNSSTSLQSIIPIRSDMTAYTEADGSQLIRAEVPLAQLVVCQGILLFYVWTSIILGTHVAIRRHYDVSDTTKLKKNKHRFRNEGKMELLDAHRAANIEALGQQLEGVMWEDDIRAAKEAVDASHYDHNANFTVHRFVRRVQDSLGNQSGGPAGNILKGRMSVTMTPVRAESKWDCRNEDPQSRGTYDIEVIEAALSVTERKGTGQRLMERQWTGALLYKEMNFVLLGMMVMASIKPNLYPMEAAFSAVFALELLLSLYFLRLEFIFYHYVRLLLRVFCIVVGFAPQAIPFVAFRSIRLLEGWHHVFDIPGMVRWGFLYCILSFLTIWMIAFVASLQVLSRHKLGEQASICASTQECLWISLRELLLPAYSPQHIDPTSEAPVMALLVLCTHFTLIPFVLAIALHPLLQLSNFIGRFLRLVVQSLHQDVASYLENYLEGASWYTHWQIRTEIPVNIVTKMKLWVNDLRRKALHKGPASHVGSVFSSFAFPRQTILEGYEMCPGTRASKLTEIVARGEFASFEENAELDVSKRSSVLDFTCLFVTRNIYVHYTNVVLTFTSIAFLWVADAACPNSNARFIVAAIIHFLSIISSLIVIPRDASAVMTLVSAVALFAAVVMQLLPGSQYRYYCCIRFLSLMRLGQMQVEPFQRTKGLVKMYMNSAMRMLFPLCVVGGIAYIVELLRAQIYMVEFNANKYRSVNWTDPATVATLRNTLSYPEFLAAYPREYSSRPNVRQTANLLAYFFAEDAGVFYSIYNFWVLPALCISSCLSYLFWIGSNLRDTNRLMVDMIPLLENPITISGLKWYHLLFRCVGNVVLVASLAFGCAISPSSNASSDDLILFFGFELAFTICGFLVSLVSMSFAAHRCASSWSSAMDSQSSSKYSHVRYGDFVFLLCELVQLLYYCVAMPLSVILLIERYDCVISPDDYATYFITLRFAFLLRMLSREFLLSWMNSFWPLFFGLSGMFLYLIVSASAVADVYAAQSLVRFSGSIWVAAFTTIVRLTFTGAVPAGWEDGWYPFNSTSQLNRMVAENTTLVFIGSNFTASTLAFILSIVGKCILSSIAGVLIATAVIPVWTPLLQPLPPKSSLLYRTLCGGLNSLVHYGMLNHDDMQPHTRRRIQRRKFDKIFSPNGIPSWAVPHLLEELNICRPTRQRRFMYSLERLLEYLPISEARHRRVREYMNGWDCYRSGGPRRLSFSTLPIYPPQSSLCKTRNPFVIDPEVKLVRHRYIAPLRLVQALAIFELSFPADSSVGSKLWMDFFSVVQKMRGATLLQSLWRMYRVEKAFDASPDRTWWEKELVAYLRRSFRKQKIYHDVSFRSFGDFHEATRYDREALNPNTGHYELLNRLRGHFSSLTPSPDFWRKWRRANDT